MAKVHDIYIFDAIDTWGGFTSKMMVDEIAAAKAQKADTLLLHINSPGGSVFEGFAIYNLIKSSGLKTVSKIEGMCASIATLIALGADKVQMSEMAQFMIHNPFTGVEGDAEKVQQTADTLKKIQDQLVASYVSRTGKSEADITEMMRVETWLNATQAKEMGFVDEITEPLNIAAYIKTFNNMSTNKAAKEALGIMEQIKALFKNTAIIKAGMVATQDGALNIYFEGDTLAAGMKVFTDEAMSMPCQAGDYVLADGSTLSIDATGTVTAISDSSSASAELEKLKTENAALKTENETLQKSVAELTEKQNALATEVTNKLNELAKLGLGKEITIKSMGRRIDSTATVVDKSREEQFKALGEQMLKKAGVTRKIN